MQAPNVVAALRQQVARPAAEFVTVTPEMAKAWLENNTRNYRRLNQKWVRSLAEDMRNYQWQENGESVKFDLAGNMLDGQHRCAACIYSNTPFRTLVVRGITDDVTVDTGKRRSLSDLLRKRGEKHYTQLSSSLRWILGYEKNSLGRVLGPTVQPTHQELLAVLDRHPDLRESMSTGMAASSLVSSAIAGSLHYIFTLRAGRESADRFFEKLVKGTDLTDIDPIFHLRQRLIKNVAAKAKLPREEVTALFVKAWNSWINGRPLSKLYWRAVGPRAEEFPEFE